MSKHPLSILPVKKHNKKPEFDLPDVFCNSSFTMLSVAPTKSGKSVGIINLLYNEAINFKKQFSEIYYISPTLYYDESLRAVANDDDIIKITDDESHQQIDVVLNEIIKQQKETPEDEKQSILIIMDDMIDFLKSKVLSNLVTKNRHFRISLVITTQSFRSVSQKIRKNTSCFLVYRNYNKKELQAIIEELGLNFDNFTKHYETATEKPYSFLYANCRDMKLYERFENLLWTKY